MTPSERERRIEAAAREPWICLDPSIHARVNAGLYPRQNFWRVGRKVGRTIYAQIGSEPSDDDPLIGLMDTPYLAAEAVEAHNARLMPASRDGNRS